MRELRLKYFIDLVSNIGARARADAQVLGEAQKQMQAAVERTGTKLEWWSRTTKKSAADLATMKEVITGTTDKFAALDRAITKAGTNTSVERQLGYLQRLALRYQDVRKAAEGAHLAERARSAGQKAMNAQAGVVAGAYVVDRFTRTPMEYSLRLAHMANTAYADRDVAGRKAGKQTLDAAITAAIRTGGGSRDDAAGALNELIASGTLSANDSMKMLPMLMRGSTASGATAEQLSLIALRAKQNFGIKTEQIPEVLNMAMAAGQAGGFELKDMAKWLPQAMALGKNSGQGGMEGLRRILASMQASVITAGTKDEAGNNVVNLLGKINSSDTAKDFEKHVGIDLTAELARQREKGVNSLDAFVSLVDGIAQQDKQYMALKAKLQQAGTQGERAETLQSMTDILQGKAIGTVIQDRQAMMALVAEMNNRGYVQRVMADTRTNTGAMSTSFDVIKDEAAFKKQQAANELAIAAQEAFTKAGPALEAVYGSATNLSREFPVLTTSVVAAAGAFGVLTAVLGATGLMGMLTGRGGKAVEKAATIAQGAAQAGAAGGAAAAGAASSGASAMARAGKLLKISGIASVLFGGIDAVSVLNDESETQKGRALARIGVTGASGALAGAGAGAVAGSFVPVVGTALGAIIGGLAAYYGSGALFDAAWAKKSPEQRDAARLALLPPAPAAAPAFTFKTQSVAPWLPTAPSRPGPGSRLPDVGSEISTQQPAAGYGYRGAGFADPRRLDAGPLRMPLAVPQLDWLTLTAPNMAPTTMQPGRTTELKVGEGRLDIAVRVTDERVTATPTMTKPLSIIRVNAGATNPGGF